MKVQPKSMILALLLVAALLLAACGNKSEAANAASEANESSAAPAAQPATVSEAPTASEAPTVSEVQGNPEKGEQLYQSACIACHGPDAKGVTGLGKSLHPSDSEFIQAQNDTELVEFIKVGRQPGDPDNTTGVAMPPKGGNPAISDADLFDIVSWIRTLE